MVRNLVRFIHSGTLLALGAGLAILSLWLAGVAWSDSENVSGGFCKGMEQWHTTQVAFQKRVNQPGSRREPGLRETYDVFEDSARVLLPSASSSLEREIRDLARSINMLQEEWLSQLHTFDAARDNTSLTTEYRLNLFNDSEETRIDANDLLREVNALLGEACNLPPLPIYD